MEISIQRLRFLEWMIAFDVTSLFVWFWFSLCFLKLLWSFISAQLGEDETNSFRLTHAIPGASKILDYEINSTFQESGLANSMISVTWDWVRVHYWVKFADWELQIGPIYMIPFFIFSWGCLISKKRLLKHFLCIDYMNPNDGLNEVNGNILKCY